MLVLIGNDIPARKFLLKFRDLAENGNIPFGASKGHKDGWGILAKSHLGNSQDSIIYERSTQPATEDPHFLDTVNRIEEKFSGIILAHLRKASKGNLSIENAHPFQNSPYYFMHNGTIYFPDLQGSDSIRYFKTMLNSYAGSIENRFQQFYKYLMQEEIQFSSITSVLSDGKAVWAIRCFSKEESYYTLRYRKESNYIVLSQQSLFDSTDSDNWITVEPNQIIKIALDTLKVETFSLIE
jgi:predicted glutamine amidotransferase